MNTDQLHEVSVDPGLSIDQQVENAYLAGRRSAGADIAKIFQEFYGSNEFSDRLCDKLGEIEDDNPWI